MKKILILLFFILFCTVNTFSQNVKIVIEITHIEVNRGDVYLAVFFNANEFKIEKPTIAFKLASNSTILRQEVSLPPGEYLISAYQDTNNNGKLDFSLIGIPKEPVAISNYFGKGFPSRNFNKQKIMIDDTTKKVVVRMYRF